MAVDPLALWGAVTGTAGLGLLGWQEFRSRRRRLSVERGWQFSYRNDELVDVWVYVMAWNTGDRPLHIEYAGFEAIVPGDRSLADTAGFNLPPENDVWTNKRFEIALNGETLEVIPDGPSVKIWTRLFPICAHNIDPTSTEIRPYVVTVPETYWFGSAGPLLPQVPPGKTREEAGEELVNAAVRHEGPDVVIQVPESRVGDVVGLARLIIEGDVEHAKDVLDGNPPPRPEDRTWGGGA